MGGERKWHSSTHMKMKRGGVQCWGKIGTKTEDLMKIVQLIVFKFHLRFYSICNRTNYFKCTSTFLKYKVNVEIKNMLSMIIVLLSILTFHHLNIYLELCGKFVLK